jgi:hypothetical protein
MFPPPTLHNFTTPPSPTPSPQPSLIPDYPQHPSSPPHTANLPPPNRALGIPPTTPTQLTEFTTVLDPEDEGFATYPPFLAICALQLHDRRHTSPSEEAHQAELDEAYALFSAAGDADAAAITLADLKRVAALLRLDQPSSGEGGGGKGKGGKKGGRWWLRRRC